MGNRWTPPQPSITDACQKQLEFVCSMLRGNCPCGAWLVLVPNACHKSNPFVCTGPCHANKKCGHTYYYEDGAWKGSAINER